MGDFGWRKPNNPYLYIMFVRKKTNRSGTISVVVVSKAHGKFTEVKKFGVAKSEEEADEMFRKAQSWLHTHDGQQELDFDDRKGKEVEETERFLSNIDNVLINPNRSLGFLCVVRQREIL